MTDHLDLPRLLRTLSLEAGEARWLASGILKSEWLAEHDAEVARVAAEKAWDEGWRATQKANPYRADAES